jgi:hypothetical protein
MSRFPRAQVVGHRDDGQVVLILQAVDQLVNMLLARLIDACGRFVEKKDVRLANKRKPDEAPLELAA